MGDILSPEDIAAEYATYDGTDPEAVAWARGLIAAAIREERSRLAEHDRELREAERRRATLSAAAYWPSEALEDYERWSAWLDTDETSDDAAPRRCFAEGEHHGPLIAAGEGRVLCEAHWGSTPDDAHPGGQRG